MADDRQANVVRLAFETFKERALRTPAVRAAYEDSGMRHFIADVLLAHQPSFQCDGDYGEKQWVECACDSDYYLDTDAGYGEHVEHQAAMLVERLFSRDHDPRNTPGSPAQQDDQNGDR